MAGVRGWCRDIPVLYLPVGKICQLGVRTVVGEGFWAYQYTHRHSFARCQPSVAAHRNSILILEFDPGLIAGKTEARFTR